MILGYHLVSNQQTQIKNNKIINECENIAKEIECDNRFYYYDKNNIHQIYLQKYIIYYYLVNDIKQKNEIVLKNIYRIIDTAYELKSCSDNLYEYLNNCFLYILIYYKDTKKVEMLIEILKKINYNKTSNNEYLIKRTEYFLGLISKKELSKYTPSLVKNIEYFDQLEKQLINRK